MATPDNNSRNFKRGGNSRGWRGYRWRGRNSGQSRGTNNSYANKRIPQINKGIINTF